MAGIDKRDAAYSMARSDLMHEMLRGGLFDMDDHDRAENVTRIVRDLKDKYPELDDQMERRLVGEGMQRSYGDATWNEAARKRRAG